VNVGKLVFHSDSLSLVQSGFITIIIIIIIIIIIMN